MSYPKPLSEKTLKNMLVKLDISEEKAEFLERFYLACVNLYGNVIVGHLWGIYKELPDSSKMTGIRRKDIISYSSVARRSDVPYYVYELDELYTEEERVEEERELVLKDFVIYTGEKRFYYWNSDAQGNKPYYIPDDLLSYAEPKMNKWDIRFIDYLKELRVTERYTYDINGTRTNNPNMGKKLMNFSYTDIIDSRLIEYFNNQSDKNPFKKKVLNNLRKDSSKNAAQKLFDEFKWNINFINGTDFRALHILMDELEEMGVRVSEKQLEKIIKLATDVNNNSNLWCNRGWSPDEMNRKFSGGRPESASFGPGLKKMIEDGEISKEELIEKLHEMGIKFEE